MAPSSRKRKSHQTITLHKYFCARSLAKKEKLIKGKQPKAQDIIVIDSDEDEPPHLGRVTADEPVSGHSHQSFGRWITHVQDEDCNEQENQKPSRDFIAFGEPSALLELKNSDKPVSPIRFVLNRFIPVANDPSTQDLETPLSSHQNITDSEIIVRNLDVEMLEQMEDWGTGDEETAGTRPEEASCSLDGKVPRWSDLRNELCPSCGRKHPTVTQGVAENHHKNCIEFPLEDHTQSNAVDCTSTRQGQKLPLLSSLWALSCNSAEQNSKRDSNAFSILMSSHQENEAWKEASVAEDHNARPSKNDGGRRKAPFFKVLQGMPIAVDAFRYGSIPRVNAYFLTHAHSDHYTNLSSTWRSGPIYCSVGTANLIIHMLSVDRKWVHPLPMDIPFMVPDTGGVRVTLIEANHCPGSSLFLFEGPQTVDAGDSAFRSPYIGSSRTFRYLHCGDFRASPQHVLHPAVKGKIIDHVYLDTTYLDPKYTFPPQPQVITACADLAQKIVSGEHIPSSAEGKKVQTVNGWLIAKDTKTGGSSKSVAERTLFVVGTYSIGKERIVKAIARILQSKVYCDKRKAAILRCQSDPELHSLLTSDPLDASVHLVPLGMITSDKLKPYIERLKGYFGKVVGFRPTGWTYTQAAGSETMPTIPSILSRGQSRPFTYANLHPTRNSTSALQLYGVPYSEHSSFFELTCFALSFNWGKMIATVNVGSETSRGKMAKWIEKWDADRRKRGNEDIVPFRQPDYW